MTRGARENEGATKRRRAKQRSKSLASGSASQLVKVTWLYLHSSGCVWSRGEVPQGAAILVAGERPSAQTSSASSSSPPPPNLHVPRALLHPRKTLTTNCQPPPAREPRPPGLTSRRARDGHPPPDQCTHRLLIPLHKARAFPPSSRPKARRPLLLPPPEPPPQDPPRVRRPHRSDARPAQCARVPSDARGED